MACEYSRFIVYLCFCALVCSVAGQNEDGRQDINITLEDDNLNTKDVRLPEEKFTSTTQNPNSEMLSSATVKKVVGSLMYTSLSVSNKNPIPNEGRKPHSLNSVKKRHFNEYDDDDQSTTTASDRDKGGVRNDPGETDYSHILEETPRNHEVTPHNREETPQNREETPQNREETPDNREETPDNREETPDNREETPDNREETPHNREETPDNREETPQNREETPDNREGILLNLEATQENSNLTENDVSPGITLRDNDTLAANDTLTEGPIKQFFTIPPPTEGYTSKRIRPPPIKPLHMIERSTKQSSLNAQKTESRANPRGMSLTFLWLLSLCPWIF